MFNRILGNIYICSLDALDKEELSKHNITHVLSILSGDLVIPSEYTHLQIQLNDEPTSNLLAVLPAAFNFINQCLYNTEDSSAINVKAPHKGSLVIHCHEGLSRSPSVLICYLMKYYKLNLKQLMYAVKRKTGDLNINDGFMKQLELFEEIKGDLKSDKYRNFLMEFSKDIKQDLADLNEQQQDQERIEETGLLRCKICREPLAKSSQILAHTKPDESSHQSLFYKKSGNYVYARLKASDSCSHYFLKDPLKWMNLTDELEGRLDCARCHAKLGGYSWRGSRCSCGKWIIPSFHLLINKVDYVKLVSKKKESKEENKNESSV